MLIFTPQTTFTTIDNYQIQNEHFPTQVYLWYYALKTLTKLAFQPPTEDENRYIPLSPKTVWRHQYSIQDGMSVEKEFALKSFFGKSESVDLIHHNLILPVRLRECTNSRVGLSFSQLVGNPDAALSLTGVRLDGDALLREPSAVHSEVQSG